MMARWGPFQNNFWADYWSNFLIDTATGLLRRGAAKPEQLAIVQKGSGEYDFVASPLATAVSASTDVLRVRAWNSNPQVTFYAFGLSMVVTGTCTTVK
ncbi:hypothetical protein [Bosea sp. Root381]|uniref:hypothetical protein n=1 Tax=Bosea sp. Root381 TaxID=1736524 RepID=UPI0012E3B633|nr:hypothetical protein [Bosea sp. Root381]